MGRKICLTFDYELFFARSGTPERCILDPTDALVASFREVGIRATFFVDATYLLRICSSAHHRQHWSRISRQLQELAAHGHELALHLHPHWLDAVFEAGEWRFPSYRRYRLHALDESTIRTLFSEGTDLLRSIQSDAGLKPEISSFRAGGLCIQPFAEVATAFREAGLTIDSSVAPGFRYTTPTHHLDFVNAPWTAAYRFSSDPVTEDTNGDLIEIPITVVGKHIGHTLMNRLTYLRDAGRYEMWGDGSGIPTADWSLRARLRNLLRSYAVLSLEGHAPWTAMALVSRSPNELLVFLSHPKCLSRSSLEIVSALSQLEGVSFKTIQQAAKTHLAESRQANPFIATMEPT